MKKLTAYALAFLLLFANAAATAQSPEASAPKVTFGELTYAVIEIRPLFDFSAIPDAHFSFELIEEEPQRIYHGMDSSLDFVPITVTMAEDGITVQSATLVCPIMKHGDEAAMQYNSWVAIPFFAAFTGGDTPESAGQNSHVLLQSLIAEAFAKSNDLGLSFSNAAAMDCGAYAMGYIVNPGENLTLTITDKDMLPPSLHGGKMTFPQFKAALYEGFAASLTAEFPQETADPEALAPFEQLAAEGPSYHTAMIPAANAYLTVLMNEDDETIHTAMLQQVITLDSDTNMKFGCLLGGFFSVIAEGDTPETRLDASAPLFTQLIKVPLSSPNTIEAIDCGAYTAKCIQVGYTYLFALVDSKTAIIPSPGKAKVGLPQLEFVMRNLLVHLHPSANPDKLLPFVQTESESPAVYIADIPHARTSIPLTLEDDGETVQSIVMTCENFDDSDDADHSDAIATQQYLAMTLFSSFTLGDTLMASVHAGSELLQRALNGGESTADDGVYSFTAVQEGQSITYTITDRSLLLGP